MPVAPYQSSELLFYPKRPSSRNVITAETTASDLDQPSSPSTAAAESPYPPPFSSLYFPPPDDSEDPNKANVTHPSSEPLPAFTAAPGLQLSSSSAAAAAEAETKAALPRDNKDGSSSKDLDDGEPPPPYSEGSSPLDSFTYVMAAAGGAASIITQVSQGGAPQLNTLAGEAGRSMRMVWHG